MSPSVLELLLSILSVVLFAFLNREHRRVTKLDATAGVGVRAVELASEILDTFAEHAARADQLALAQELAKGAREVKIAAKADAVANGVQPLLHAIVLRETKNSRGKQTKKDRGSTTLDAPTI